MTEQQAAPSPSRWVERTRAFPYFLDGALGLALASLLIRSALLPEPVRAWSVPGWAGIGAAAACGLAVALRRVAPLPMLALSFGTCVLAYLGGFQRDPFLAAGLVLYVVAAERPKLVSLSALLALAGALLLTFAVVPAASVADKPRADHWIFIAQSVAPIAVQSAAWAIGFAVRRQRAYIAAIQVQARDQVRAQQELAWRTVTEERLRIARELHDVVAHSMSVITVQAGVGGHILAEQPEQARAALDVIETTGREALQELRRLLGVLRADAGDTARAPAPRIADLDEMIRRVRQAGTTVDLDIRGPRRALPGGVELSAYRIVQEALTNVVKHAGTDRCRIRLAYAADALSIEVTDDGVGARPVAAGHGIVGHGIVGMRERAALHGGGFEAGPLPVRGFRVAASLPLESGRA